jgi:DNA-binding response OmpR family regulator
MRGREQGHTGGNGKAGAPGRQPTVLLVEDNEAVRHWMATVLVREGYLVLNAGSARDAMGVLYAPLSPIDVVVLDVHLPDASGVDVCARVQELHPRLPVIVCTGAATPDEAAELLRLGAHRYLVKPVSPDELLAAVEASLA